MRGKDAKSQQEDILLEQTRIKQLLADTLKLAKTNGATQAEASASISAGFSVNVRMGDVETVEYNRDQGIGISVYFGKKKGSASSSDMRPEAIQDAVHAACNIAKYTTEDPYAGLADKSLMGFDCPDLDLYHPWDLAPEQAIDMAKVCETQGLSVDKRLFNSEGAHIATHQNLHAYANSHDFLDMYPTTRHSVSCVLLAKQGDDMQRDFSYSITRDANALRSMDSIAKEAADRTLKRLGAKKLTTRKAPVIFAADIAKGLLGSFISAISGGNLYRKASFLVDHLGKQIFPVHIRIFERPHLQKGLGSAPFDDEGVATKPRDIVKEGVLQGYVLSSYSARKLGLQTTANAGGVHNLEIDTSDKDLAALLQQMGTGLLVTEVMGQGVNTVTGDYSRGAAGFWVENGTIQYPVHEITIAGNLKNMYQQIICVGNDLELRGNVRTGSILIEEMTIAGE